MQPPPALPAMFYPTNISMGDKEFLPLLCEDQGYSTSNTLSGWVEQNIPSSLIELSSESSLEPHSSDSGEMDCIGESGPVPRRPFQSPQDRQQTAQTRKLTACIRCRMQRIRV